ncbi:bifunctional 3'-5' exonuclease/DNA polymerase [Microbacterium candidum]|uniref:DNA-directed DNA polymerase n=1 Tax=Microbacterium candidum TaxID=3041922 RepID=A0ABT7MZ12_9MICO|nr:bifunctional 3'-5' exonuclease/DNA polymerase [Microbacterium sp. ASV49]MDL9979685.1 bifunctional 3'-5' exonuclease/DNA polymerase [Microbacterium sp. ASV49]
MRLHPGAYRGIGALRATAESHADPQPAPAWIAVGRDGSDVVAVRLAADGAELSRVQVSARDFAAFVAAEPETRWVWSDTPAWHPGLLSASVRVARAHDLRLCHAILRDSALVEDDRGLRAAREWDAAPSVEDVSATLFDLEEIGAAGPPDDIDAALAEFARQRAAVDASKDPGRLRLLLAAESAGALIAVEMRIAGLPWDAAEHERLLTEILGARPAAGGMPVRMQELAEEVRIELRDPAASLDSQPKLLRSLHRAGVLAESTSRWELARYEHPAISPLIQYKRLARLYTANGWSWLAEWVRDGRFRPVYVPAGVVTGRWASSGGGALQIPRNLRPAVKADPGWALVVADVAQLEPRVLAAMSGDAALARAARGQDLYAGIVDSGAVATRAEAKVAILGAMYGATTGDSGRLLPALRRTYPRAMALVDEAARVGQQGGVVSTWLGRTSPATSEGWREVQGAAAEPDASAADEARARRRAADRGRFTRNFVVQGTAAEWALAWLADLRTRLAAMPPVEAERGAPASGRVFATRPHLAFFLHDEIIVHTPAERADEVAVAVREAAASAARLLFGDFPVDFPLDLRIAQTAAKD